jgi:hypothetical protein
VILGFLLACRTVLVPDVDLPEHDPTPAWGDVLHDVVDARGMVDYDELERDRGYLDDYVAWIGRADAVPKQPKKRVAFWLNAYNALVLYQVLEHGRPASVLDVGKVRFFALTAFDIGRDEVSLEEIEDERLRHRVQDPRLHAALNCASRSCPPLLDELYAYPGLDRQLQEEMRRWIADDERGVRIEGDHAVFSPIFEWYADDFDLWTGGIDPCAYAAKFAAREKRATLLELSDRGCPREYFAYDWRLNQGD